MKSSDRQGHRFPRGLYHPQGAPHSQKWRRDVPLAGNTIPCLPFCPGWTLKMLSSFDPGLMRRLFPGTLHGHARVSGVQDGFLEVGVLGQGRVHLEFPPLRASEPCVPLGSAVWSRSLTPELPQGRGDEGATETSCRGHMPVPALLLAFPAWSPSAELRTLRSRAGSWGLWVPGVSQTLRPATVGGTGRGPEYTRGGGPGGEYHRQVGIWTLRKLSRVRETRPSKLSLFTSVS